MLPHHPLPLRREENKSCLKATHLPGEISTDVAFKAFQGRLLSKGHSALAIFPVLDKRSAEIDTIEIASMQSYFLS